MALTQTRESRRQRRRVPSRAAQRPVIPCAVAGCAAPGDATCARCGRNLCRRHAGPAPTSNGARRALASGARSPARCALCRLEERRRGQTLVRRLWWGAAAAGFAVFTALAFRSNMKQGLALVALVVLIAVLALFYDRAMRRR